MDNKILYRPDIDGLRAIAVLSVFAFHLGLYRFARGGFVGVDIFFVISGYLITQIVSRQIRHGSFNLASFYRRRALRILPAFFVMLLGTLAAALILLPPVELVEFGRSAISSSFSASNIFFYFSPSGYFFDDLNARPLLHTWSLGVEEQFYILFPLLLLAVHRRARDKLRWAIIITGLLSFLISLWSLRNNPDGAFFLLPSRFWELMLGAAAALDILPAPKGRASRETTSIVGAAMIGLSIITTDGGYLPYYWAILPCIGAIAVIISGESTAVGKALSWKPLVWIGLISYSLYLWHWPVIVFDHVALLRPLTNVERAGIFLVSLALSVVSYFLIERPFRSLPRTIPNWRVLIPAGAAMAAGASLGLAMILSAGLPERFSSAADSVSAYLDPRGPDRFRSGTCFISKPNEHFDWAKCLGRDDGERRTILFGDSHAAALYPALRNLPGLRQVTTTYCRPLMHMDRLGLPFCAQIVERFFGQYLQAKHPGDTVIIAERWQHGQEADALETVAALRHTGARVILIGPVPEYFAPLPRLEFAELTWRKPPDLREYLDPTISHLDRAFYGIAAQTGSQYVSAETILCQREECDTEIRPGVPTLSDTDHLTPEAAAMILRHAIL